MLWILDGDKTLEARLLSPWMAENVDYACIRYRNNKKRVMLKKGFKDVLC